MNIKIRNIKNIQLEVKVKLSSGETIDFDLLDRFQRAFLKGFLKPHSEKKSYIYTGPVGVQLSKRLTSPMTKKDFCYIIEQIVVAVQKLNTNNLPLKNLVMNTDYIFMNDSTKEVQFVYVPIINGFNNMNLVDLIINITLSSKPEEQQDYDFLCKFADFFNNMKPFDINGIEQFIAQEEKSVVNNIKKQNVGQSGFITNKQKQYYEHYGQQIDSQTVVENNQNQQSSPNMSFSNGNVIKQNAFENSTGNQDTAVNNHLFTNISNQQILNTTISAVIPDDDATGLLVENNENFQANEITGVEPSVVYPIILRVSTGEKMTINKPVFRIGKETRAVDWTISDTSVVSRNHADIITRGDRYFIKDLGSRNYTYVNNMKISDNLEYEIKKGDNIRLANEEFVFGV